MNKEKDKTKTEEKHKVTTPTPPQDMDPSKTPPAGKKVLGDEGKKNGDGKKK